jgi:excinuclease ABC subunit B
MIGRAARNANGKVLLYADHVTESMRAAIDETERRRAIQTAYNQAHGIVPQTVTKKVADLIRIGVTDENRNKKSRRGEKKNGTQLPTDKPALSCSPAEEIERLREEMKQCAKELRFEEAAFLRDKIRELEKAAGQGSPAGK